MATQRFDVTSEPEASPAAVSQYDIATSWAFSPRRRGIADEDIRHAVEHALVSTVDEEARVLYLGPGRAGNLLEVVAVIREDGSELAIHAMLMRKSYELLLQDRGRSDDQ